MTALADLIRPKPDLTALTANRILIWDIETFPAKSVEYLYQLKRYNNYTHHRNIVEPGGMLSWAAMWADEPTKVYYSDVHDEHMLPWLWSLLDEADIDVTYNGGDARNGSGGFDHKKVRGYLARANMVRPRPSKSIDLIKTVRDLGFESNSLEYACRMLDTKHRKLVEIGSGGWQGVLEGDKLIRKLHRRYGTHDVRCTYDVFMKLLPEIKGFPHVGFTASDSELRCPRCGAADKKRAGTYTANVIRYTQHRCENCGGLYRSTRHSRVGGSRAV